MAVLTATDVANRAFDLIGTQPIGNIFTDNTKESSIALRNFHPCRRAVLRMHPWNFAIRQAKLDSPDPVAPTFNWVSRFRLPLDFIRLMNLDDTDTDYRIQGLYVVTNVSSVELEYVYDHYDVDDWDSLFFDAMAHYYAWFMCFTITQSNSLKEDLEKGLKTAMNKARFIDSAEEPHKILDGDIWLRSRLGPNQGFVRDPMTDHG